MRPTPPAEPTTCPISFSIRKSSCGTAIRRSTIFSRRREGTTPSVCSRTSSTRSTGGRVRGRVTTKAHALAIASLRGLCASSLLFRGLLEIVLQQADFYSRAAGVHVRRNVAHSDHIDAVGWNLVVQH